MRGKASCRLIMMIYRWKGNTDDFFLMLQSCAEEPYAEKLK